MGRKTKLSSHRFFWVFAIVVVAMFAAGAQATTYYSDYGRSRTHNITVTAGTHSFQINGIARYKTTKWYVDGVYKETDESGFWAIDPEYTRSFSSGTTEIKGKVYDSGGTYEESHTWNVTVAKPDLIVQDISISPSSPTAGQSATITATIKNQGNADASSFKIKYYVDGSYIGEDTLSFGLNAGSSNNETIRYTASSSGNHTVKVLADSSYQISESSETNNERQETYYWNPPPKPDLIVQDISISPSSPVAGQSVTITATLKNQGNADADAFDLKYYVDDSYIGDDRCSWGLGTGDSDNESISYTVSESGNHTVKVFVDSRYEVDEGGNENNNTREETYYWSSPPKPDLIVQDISISPSSPTAGQSATITATIKNQGNADASSFKIKYYVDGSYIGEDTLSFGLNAGSSNNETIRYTASSSGNHTVKVLADSSYQISESSETNNERQETYYWNPPPNQDPELSNGYVTPTSGDTTTDFYYYVDYYDPDGDLPDIGQVTVYGDPLTWTWSMSLYSGSPSNGTYRSDDGINLELGSHSYEFYFTDGNGGEDTLTGSGPTVDYETLEVLQDIEVGSHPYLESRELQTLDEQETQSLTLKGRAQQGIAAYEGKFYTSAGMLLVQEMLFRYAPFWGKDNVEVSHQVTYDTLSHNFHHLGDIDVYNGYVYGPLTDGDIIDIAWFDGDSLDYGGHVDMSWIIPGFETLDDISGLAFKDDRLYILGYETDEDSEEPYIFIREMNGNEPGDFVHTYIISTWHANGLAFKSDYVFISWGEQEFNPITGYTAYIDIYKLPLSDFAEPIKTYQYSAEYIHAEGITFYGDELWVAQNDHIYQLENPLPKAPTGVSASDGEYTDKVRVIWNTVSDADGYEVYRNTSNDPTTATKIGTNDGGMNNLFDDYDIVPDVNYCYWIRAGKDVGGVKNLVSEFGTYDCGYVGDPPAYSLNININGSGSVTKDPDKVSYNLGEDVSLQANPASGYIFDSWSGDLSGTDNPATITMDSNKDITANFIFVVDVTPPSVPQNLNAIAVDQIQIDLSWDASNDPESGISYYRIYRDGIQIDTSVSTFYSNTGLNAGTTYSYEVSAVNGAGLESNRSNTAQATTFSDTTPPAIVSVGASETSLEIVFNEPLDTMSAEDINNYSITGGISVIAASLDTDTVTLSTSSHTEGTYTLTVENVKDTSGNPMTKTTTDYQYNDGLAGYWKFNDAAGSTVADSSGNSSTGTLINGPVWTVQGELSFDGIDDAVEIPTANWDASNGTIALWAKAADLSGTRYLFGHTVGSWSNRIQLYVNEGNLCLGLGSSHSLHPNVENLALQTWYHIALTWDGTDYVVYVDGIAKASGPYTSLTELNTFADIGNNGNASFRDQAFNGIIDEVRVYNRALIADEVSNLALVFLPIDDKEVEEGLTLTFEVRTKDPNQEVLIESHNLPSDPNFFSNIFSWMPTYGDAGSYEVTFEAPHGEFVDFETITITVHKPIKPVYRFWSPINSRHFYTIKEAEKDKLLNIYAHVWTYESIAYYAFETDSEPGLVPVYRFWSPVLIAHFYTISESERDKLINIYPHVWTYEGIAFYAYPEGQQPVDTLPVYRFWSPVLETHFYTMNETEKNKLIDNYPHVWTYEGIAWYAYTSY